MNRNCYRHWIACLLLLAPGACLLPAAESVAPPATTLTPAAGGVPSVSGGAQVKRADWQQRLTLGPGDTLNLQLFDMPDSARTEVPVGPDGRISFLQAHDVMAAGLTVDELPAKMDEALAKFYQNPHSIITPVAYYSKKYLMLGAVVNKGVYTFDRPLRVIEAIARAGGLETGLYAARTVELADLQRSFLVRKTEDNTVSRIPIDFEALFQQGDLSQNVALAPGDYVYLPPTGRQEVYVLGEVRSPGLVPFSKDLTALGAITARSSFTDRAWKAKVLIVRGSFSHPETIVVNTSDILKARGVDMPLANRDIVYVHRKPWAKAQEILESAISDFANAAAIGWTGLHVGPFITEPIFK